MGVMPVVAAARGRATACTTTTKATASRTVAGVRPAGLARVSGTGEQRVTVRFAYGPGAIRASVKVCAESSTMDPAENGSAKSTFSASMQAPSMAKIGSQLGGGGAATLEKVGMDLSQQVQQVSSAKLADGGGGGNMGGGIKNGGGGGDGDEGDDDDYYDEGDDEDGDSNFLTTRAPLGEMYERDAINAVMQEWFKTLTTLPAAIRMAIEMGAAARRRRALAPW